MLGVFILFSAALLYFCLTDFNIRVLILTVIFLAFLILYFIPNYIRMEYTLGEYAISIRVGLFVKRDIEYRQIYAFQQSLDQAKASYGLSEKHIAIYFCNDMGGNDVITVSPKDQQGFLTELANRTGIQSIKPNIEYRDKQAEYTKGATQEQRKRARKRLLSMVINGYQQKTVLPESPESLHETQTEDTEQSQA
jgi:hypothetical protein